MSNIDSFDKDSLWHLAIQNYYPKIVNVVYYLTRDWFLAEDIAQETFAIAIEKFAQLRDSNKFLPWLTAIAVNLTKDCLKHKQKTVLLSYTDLASIEKTNDPSGIITERIEAHKVVTNALSKLSSQEQKVVVLKYYLDLKEKDIALSLGISIGTVKKLLFRARSKLCLELQYFAQKEGED